MARWAPSIFLNGIDIDAVDSAVDMPYDIPNLQVEYVRAEPPAVPTGFWRGVGPNNNVFATECFMDELARKAGKDPVEFRRGMLKAIRVSRRRSNLSRRNPAGASRCRRASGVASACSRRSAVSSRPSSRPKSTSHGEVRLRRVTSAVDTGIAVNPDTIVAQLQGGLIFGLTAALFGEITIEKGRVQQSNFNDYRMLRIDEVPKIDVHVIKSGEDPGGIGETGVHGGAAGVAQCDLCRDRDRVAEIADRPQRARRCEQGVSVMRRSASSSCLS